MSVVLVGVCIANNFKLAMKHKLSSVKLAKLANFKFKNFKKNMWGCRFTLFVSDSKTGSPAGISIEYQEYIWN